MTDASTGISGAARSEALTEKYGDHDAGAVLTASEQACEHTSKGVVETVKDKVHDASAGASALLNKAKDTAQEWASSTAGAAVHVKNVAQNAASSAADMAGTFGRDVTALIRRHPRTALLIGFGAGCLLAQVLRRASSPRS
jgi:predicted phage tail protein